MASSFSAKCLSLESLKVRLRCGFKPCAFQSLPTVESLNPLAAAMVLRLHWVAAGGFSSSVRLITCRLRAAEIVGMRPDRGASMAIPSKPRAAYRSRQRATL